VTMNSTPEEFAKIIESMEGTPWVHQGRNRYGVDCIGAGFVAGWEIGLEIKDFRAYPRKVEPRRLLTGLRTILTDLGKSKPRLGDVILFRLPRASHVGFITGQTREGLIIHHCPEDRYLVPCRLDPDMIYRTFRWPAWLE